MTRVRRLGPNTAMPKARPSASIASPPSLERREPGAELDPRVDQAATHAAPLRAGVGDDPERRGGRAVTRSDDERERADRRRAGGRGRLRQIRTLDAQKRDVGRWIAADQLGAGRGAVVGDDLDVAVVGERVLRRHDEAWAPDEAARFGALRLHGDDARRRAADEVGERRRRRRSKGRGWT